MAGARRTRTTPMSTEPSTEPTNQRDTVRPEPVPAGGEAEKLSPFEDASQVPPKITTIPMYVALWKWEL